MFSVACTQREINKHICKGNQGFYPHIAQKKMQPCPSMTHKVNEDAFLAITQKAAEELTRLETISCAGLCKHSSMSP